jgi:hypothetical protein
VPLLLLGPPFLSDYSFRVHNLVNQDDLQLLANAMASGFSVAWQSRGLCYDFDKIAGKLAFLAQITAT